MGISTNISVMLVIMNVDVVKNMILIFKTLVFVMYAGKWQKSGIVSFPDFMRLKEYPQRTYGHSSPDYGRRAFVIGIKDNVCINKIHKLLEAYEKRVV